ncbi:MAG TPA: hypothetical protein VKQ05_08005 [Gemmatimonadales bacterium]|nr:hypothetical protein [Gemmatimonadales bacterium]
MRPIVWLILAGFATSPLAGQGTPCCNIVSLNANGLVSAKVTATGRAFQFQVKDQTLLTSLHVGQQIWANFTSRAVSLAANVEPCCSIVTAAVGPKINAGPARTPTATPFQPCCEITANPALTGRMGRLVLAFPQGADAGSSPVAVYRASETQPALSSYGAQTWDLLPGNYVVTISGARVQGVTVQAGHDTRVRTGILRIKAEGATSIDVLDAGGTKITGGYGSRVIGLPVGNFQVKLAGQAAPVTIKEGQITDF